MSEQDKELQDNRALYQKLSKKYTKEELVESFVFPPDMTAAEKQKADQKLWVHRKQRLLNRTPEEKLYANLLKLKYELEDYTLSNNYHPKQSISYYLRNYMRIVGRNQKELSSDIAIHPTRWSRILNGKERLSLSLAYRLERHAGDLLPALLWWKLMQKEIEQEIKRGTDEQDRERSAVTHVVYSQIE
jgi:plasmid maintenance system antidote protein VapI